ncbi:hypothetical protein PENTCL1PPCAC_8872, partial [Pristionchus entomophagus]
LFDVMRYKKVCLTLLLAAGVFSLECVFEVKAGATQLDVEGGIDKCESSDQYCAMVRYIPVENCVEKDCLHSAQLQWNLCQRMFED